ncbi:MAG: hypothetical protein CVU78_05320 [Elusimicrobia bacterium HGW-Elusimicrobia-2]|nr:MAG: hypothetical protein CVU78_05320 [Elusimicrobia bacterium HGW-Elusimicrobia-2]
MMNSKITKRNRASAAGLIFVIAVCCLSVFTVRSFAAFFDTGLSARGAAMGGAYSTMYGSPDLIFYNPAGLKNISNPELSVYYHNPFSGLLNVDFNTTAISFAMPVYMKGVFGIGYTQFAAGDSQDRLYQETSLWAALSYKVSERFQTGVTLKQLSHEYFPDDRTMSLGDKTFDSSWSASALTADIGMRAVLSRTLNAAITYQNMLPADIGIYDKDEVPSIMRFAGDFTNGKFTLAVAQDIRSQDWGDKTTTCVGSEWRISQKLAMRAGYNNDEVSFGFGINMKVFGEDNLAFNYAYSVPSGISSVVSHRLELKLRRGEKVVREKPQKAEKKEIFWEDKGEEIDLE